MSEGLSVRQVAAEAGVCEQTVYRALRRAGIELRRVKPSSVRWTLEGVLTYEFLVDRYVDRGLTCSEIAREVDCSVAAVWNWLKRRGIETRGVRPAERLVAKSSLSEPYLRARYVVEGATLVELGDEVNVDPGTVAAYLDRYGHCPSAAAPSRGRCGHCRVLV